MLRISPMYNKAALISTLLSRKSVDHSRMVVLVASLDEITSVSKSEGEWDGTAKNDPIFKMDPLRVANTGQRESNIRDGVR